MSLPSKLFFICLLFLCCWVGLCFSPGSTEAALVSLLKPQEISQLSGYKIVDARPVTEWRKGHIPNALPLHWQGYTKGRDSELVYHRLAPEMMAQRLGQLGINETTPLIVYGDADSSWGGEGWVCWLLSELGHVGEIYLLEGGVQSWLSQYAKLSTGSSVATVPVTYRLARRVELDIATVELLEQQEQLQIVDTRSFFEWLRSSIPGAVRINWTSFFTGKERTPISKEQLVELLHEHDIDPDKPVVYFCSGGVRSAYAWTVHELAGLKTAKNYAGGMVAWKMNRIFAK